MKKELKVEITHSGLFLDNDISYTQVPGWLGQATRDLKLSVIRHQDTSKKLPVLFWFAGGGWMDTHHNIHLPNLIHLAHKGYVIVGVEYRDSNKINFPGQLQDAKAAIRYIKANADKFGVDVHKVIVMGESAGGHLASMLGVTNGLDQFEIGNNKEQNSNVNIAVPLYGVVSPLSAKQGSAIRDFDFVYRNLLGAEPENAPELNEAANPLSYINNNTVPFLIFHGTKDVIVPAKDSQTLYDALQAQNIPSDFYELPDAEHMDPKFLQPEIMDLVDEFVQQHI
ncbi:MAG TPA: alpha/beta hydrolase [Edaphocola sp.]|nr:alpha/beta hydrolase [Edaphocola sp.]